MVPQNLPAIRNCMHLYLNTHIFPAFPYLSYTHTESHLFSSLPPPPSFVILPLLKVLCVPVCERETACGAFVREARPDKCIRLPVAPASP